MLKKISQWALGLVLLVSFEMTFAAGPVDMLQSVSNQMLSYLQQHQSQLSSQPKLISAMVERVLVPHIEVNRMAGTVVGRQIWQQATPEQKNQFVQAFKSLVIKTYADALASYNNDQIRFYPLRGGDNGQSATVNSVIIRQNGQRISISYNVIKQNSQWWITDFSIEGVSMVQSYQSQFAGPLSQGGLTGLTQRLETYNRGQ